MESYLELLSEFAESGHTVGEGIEPIAEAFRVASVIRSRAVQEAIAANSARAAAKTPELADLVRVEQDTEMQIGALYSLLRNASSRSPDEHDPGALRRAN